MSRSVISGLNRLATIAILRSDISTSLKVGGTLFQKCPRSFLHIIRCAELSKQARFLRQSSTTHGFDTKAHSEWRIRYDLFRKIFCGAPQLRGGNNDIHKSDS